jgi:thioredoxin-like negative regulator of GroEL
VAEARDSAADTEQRSALVHRETFQLIALIALAIAAFLVTRAIAISNREMTLRDAAEWFRRGQLAMETGHIDEAIDSLRRATVRDRNDKRYVLTLAQALALKHDQEGARSLLMTLRESEPEDRDINLQLARLAAARQDVTEALRFYHNTLYATWPPEMVGARRAVRIELARFLLSHGQSGRAIAELLALGADMPDELALHLEMAQLFADAGDQPHALDQFQRALRQDPDNRAAIAGAGLAAFSVGDYTGARSLLRRLPPDADNARATRELADLVLSKDPLATRIGSTERRQRLMADVGYVDQRIQACNENGNRSEASAALANEAQAFKAQLANPGGLEQDTVEAGVDLIERLEAEISQRCGPTTPLDQALALIGRQHRVDLR